MSKHYIIPKDSKCYSNKKYLEVPQYMENTFLSNKITNNIKIYYFV